MYNAFILHACRTTKMKFTYKDVYFSNGSNVRILLSSQKI